MLQPDLIIQCGTLLTMVEGEKPIRHATLLIRGDRIAGILAPGEERPPFKGVQVLDATDSIVMPGLVNAHGHTAMTLFRGLADDLPLKQWLFEKIFPAEAKHLSEETVVIVEQGISGVAATGERKRRSGYPREAAAMVYALNVNMVCLSSSALFNKARYPTRASGRK